MVPSRAAFSKAWAVVAGMCGPAALGEAAGAGPVLDGQDAGEDRRGDPGPDAGVAEAEEGLGLEEELGDGRGRAGVDLALQEVDVGLRVGGVGVRLGVGAHADREAARARQRLDQLDRRGEALRVRP